MHDEAQNEIGTRLRQERVKLGLTQDEAARGCNVTKDMWSKYERGLHNPKRLVLAAFQEKFGADAAFIQSGERAEVVKTPQANADADADEQLKLVIRAYQLASPDGRAAICQVTRALATAYDATINQVTPVFVSALVTGGQLRLHASYNQPGAISATEQALIDAYQTCDERRKYMIWVALDSEPDAPGDEKIDSNGIAKWMLRLVDCYRNAPERGQYIAKVTANIDDGGIHTKQNRSGGAG